MKHYVSNKQETPRMFQSDFMEYFSRVHWTVPLIVYIPIISGFVFLAVTRYKNPAGRVASLFVGGLALWTLAEYLLHRFVFHYHPSSEWGRRIHWTFHGVHHDFPSDPLRLVMPPAVSIPLAALFYVLFVNSMGVQAAMAFTPGFLLGYLFYDITHYAVHHFPIKGRVFGKLREFHMRHHYKSPELGFGVSSPLWDVVFRTTFHRG